MTGLPVFDHHSSEANADPRAYYRRYRTECPMGRSNAHGGFVYTTRYDDIVRIARNDALFSSARSEHGGTGVGIVIPKGDGLEQYPIELDPPSSAAYRNLINPLLTPAAVERMAPMIERHVVRIVDAFIEAGACDLVRDLTNPLPAAVTLDWLGFPEADWAALARPIHDIFAAVAGSERARRGAAGLAYMDERIRDLVRARREAPLDDAVSILANSRRDDGTLFDEAELVSVIGLLIAGGVDTTTSLTGWTLVHLSRHPEQRQRLIDFPELLEAATEEFLRAFTPAQAMARTVTHDTEIDGCSVMAGERVLIPWIAANHDPAVFPHPDEVQLDRDARRHLSFGIGSHRCAGAHMARAMFQQMMRQVLTRLPDYQVVEEGLVLYPTQGNQTGWDAIPAVFTPAARSCASDGMVSATLRPISLTVSAKTRAADAVHCLTLTRFDGLPLPNWEPGSHIEVRLPSGRVRQYSLCGDPARKDEWRIAVSRDGDGRGGSMELCDDIVIGASLSVRGPRNHFPLVDAPEYLFLAGGIGVTPIAAMARRVADRGSRFRLVYGGRDRSSMAFIDELKVLSGDSLVLVPRDEQGLPDIDGLIATLSADTAIYACGPAPMLAAIEQTCARLNCLDRLYVERFSASTTQESCKGADDRSFDVQLVRTGTTLHVPVDRRMIDIIRAAVPSLSYDCEQGHCGACETRVLAGVPDHRDSILNDKERAAGRTMMICVGRCRSDRLILDL